MSEASRAPGGAPAPYREVVVGTDGSDTAARAVRVAGGLAAAVHVPTLIAVVYQRPRPSDFGPPSMQAESTGEQWQGAGYRAAMDTAQQAAADLRAHGIADVDTIAVEGHPAEALIELSAERAGALLAVGNRGMDASSRFLLGNVPNRVSHHADGDVLIVQTDAERQARPPERVLVGTDGSDTAVLAVERAASLCAALGASLRIMSAGSDAPAKEAVDAAGGVAEAAGVPWSGEVVPTGPAEALLDAATDVDLVVVGNRGMTGAQRFLLGSVPNRVSHHASCDVLIVKTTATSTTLRRSSPS